MPSWGEPVMTEPAPGGVWAAGPDFGGDDSGWKTGNNASNADGFGDAAGDGFGDAAEPGNSGDDRACYNCGQPGHTKADCPNPRIFTGTCRTCGQEGHMSKDCPERPPRPDGPLTCYRCGEEGHGTKTCPQPAVCNVCNSESHLAKECPDKICDNCGEKGHSKLECENARKLARDEFPDVESLEAWTMFKEAVKDRELVDVKFALQTYLKANPEVTFPEIEDACRGQNIGLWLIAKEEDLSLKTTNMDLQGNMGKKYTVVYSFNPKPRRQLDRDWWPTPEDNLERLKDAGDAVPRGIPLCDNCGELGHGTKHCTKEKLVIEDGKKGETQCVGCGEEGHRLRDCPQPHPDYSTDGAHTRNNDRSERSADDVECRKCNKTGHFARDCPEVEKCRNCDQPGHRAADCDKCRNCGETGHQSTECDKPRDMSKVQCRNCDEYGHTGRECPKPRDYTRVKCTNCGEMGHTKVRCNAPPQEADGAGFDNATGFDNDAKDGGGDGGGWVSNADNTAGGDAGGDTDGWGASGNSGGGGGW